MRWDDDELFAALARYETLARNNGMTEKGVHSYWDYARRFLEWRIGSYQPRGIDAGRRPTSGGPAAVSDLREQAKTYAKAIEDAGRAQDTIDTYYRHAMFFVRWLGGDFTPGARTRRRA